MIHCATLWDAVKARLMALGLGLGVGFAAAMMVLGLIFIDRLMAGYVLVPSDCADVCHAPEGK